MITISHNFWNVSISNSSNIFLILLLQEASNSLDFINWKNHTNYVKILLDIKCEFPFYLRLSLKTISVLINILQVRVHICMQKIILLVLFMIDNLDN
jgi:hypothetical protein